MIRGRVPFEHYVSMRVRRGINRLVNPSAVPLKSSILKDKARFVIKLADAGLDRPPECDRRELARWIGRGGAGVQPSEIGSPWAFGGRPWFTDSGHQGHLHVGFAGPTQAGGR